MNPRTVNIELSPDATLWLARIKAQHKRRSPLQRRFDVAFAVKRLCARRNVLAWGEDPTIYPLSRVERTQVIYPTPRRGAPLTVRYKSPGLDRWAALIRVQEGSPLCN